MSHVVSFHFSVRILVVELRQFVQLPCSGGSRILIRGGRIMGVWERMPHKLNRFAYLIAKVVANFAYIFTGLQAAIRPLLNSPLLSSELWECQGTEYTYF